MHMFRNFMKNTPYVQFNNARIPFKHLDDLFKPVNVLDPNWGKVTS